MKMQMQHKLSAEAGAEAGDGRENECPGSLSRLCVPSSAHSSSPRSRRSFYLAIVSGSYFSD